jgi:hypothetical protein
MSSDIVSLLCRSLVEAYEIMMKAVRQDGATLIPCKRGDKENLYKQQTLSAECDVLGSIGI